MICPVLIVALRPVPFFSPAQYLLGAVVAVINVIYGAKWTMIYCREG
jgi:hypothetical protein